VSERVSRWFRACAGSLRLQGNLLRFRSSLGIGARCSWGGTSPARWSCCLEADMLVWRLTCWLWREPAAHRWATSP